MNRPDTKLPPEWKAFVGELEDKLAEYEEDPSIQLYYALKKKMEEIVDVLTAYNLADQMMLGNKHDKAFERLRALWQDSRQLISDMKWMRQELGITGNEEVDKAKSKKPIIERTAR